VGYIRLSAANHQSITNMLPDDGDVYAEDFTMIKSKRPGYEFGRPAAGSKPAYITAGLTEQVKAEAEKWLDGSALVKRLGKELSPLGWKMLLRRFANGGEEAFDEEDGPANPKHSLESIKGIGEIAEEDDDLAEVKLGTDATDATDATA
jgi:hypothetical protein